MRLVRRLTLHLLVPIGLLFALDTVLTLRSDLALLDSDLRRDEAMIARELAIAVERIWSDRGEAAALELADRWQAVAGDVGVRIVLLDAAPGTERAPGAPEAAALPASAPSPLQLRGERRGEPRLFTYVRLEAPGPQRAAIEISESLAHESAHLAARIPRKLLTAAAMVLLCGVVAWQIGARVVGRPVDQLIEKARRIGAGDFTRPLALERRDEISDLAAAMNAMAATLDASARRLADESAARIAALEQLRHADRLTTVGKLAAGLAHELGTPLNVVSGRAQMIASGEIADPGDVVRSARVVREQADRMTRIVRQLLDCARHRGGERRDTDLDRLARETLALLAPLAARRGVRVACAGPEAPVRARVDAGQIQQALANLVMNAVQASPRDAEVSVRVSAREIATPPAVRPPGRYAELEVVDRGTGIPLDELPAIFDPFFTTKPVGEGTGLGLAVVHGIVEEHGGWVQVASEPGRGSRFTMSLPTEEPGWTGGS
jgi:signal transduction histidine kinase